MKRRRNNAKLPRSVSLGSHSGVLRIVAFSDWRVGDIDLLGGAVERLQPPPDLILYGGDDISRFRPSDGRNLFERLAVCARFGLCAVAGNDELPVARRLISGKSVFNVHNRPVVLGEYAIIGVDGAPYRKDLEGIGFLLHSEQEIRTHLRAHATATAGRKLIVISHAPPEGVLDQAQRFSESGEPRSIGSRALRKFMRGRKEICLLVCGHVHRCGGMRQKVGRALVVNAANHDDFRAEGRFAIIELGGSGSVAVEWRKIREVSVVPGIGPASAARLREVGIRTVEDLAAAPPEVVNSLLRFGHQPEVLQARAHALVERRPIFLHPPRLWPGPEVFLDIETDLAQTYVWLIGLCAGREGSYTKFFAQTSEE